MTINNTSGKFKLGRSGSGHHVLASMLCCSLVLRIGSLSFPLRGQHLQPGSVCSFLLPNGPQVVLRFQHRARATINSFSYTKEESVSSRLHRKVIIDQSCWIMTQKYPLLLPFHVFLCVSLLCLFSLLLCFFLFFFTLRTNFPLHLHFLL